MYSLTDKQTAITGPDVPSALPTLKSFLISLKLPQAPACQANFSHSLAITAPDHPPTHHPHCLQGAPAGRPSPPPWPTPSACQCSR
jgi:hypothetical protein